MQPLAVVEHLDPLEDRTAGLTRGLEVLVPGEVEEIAIAGS